MKTNFVRQTSLGLAAGLTFFLGCARPSAEQSSPAIVSATPVVVAQAAPPANDLGPTAPPSVDTNAPAILERIEPTVKADSVSVSPGLAEVVKLAQAGVSEEVMLAYVDKYTGSFNVGADQILYLNDLGVSSTVITAMLKRDGNTSATANAAAPVSVAPTAPATPVYAEATAPTVATAVAPPPTSTEVSYFYDSLSPYGSWIYLSGYGWCWQPTVAVSVSSWRPYCDRGRWYWSDSGWYWNSDYSWGWAAFHYGRWYHHARTGWVWTPGLAWAPSWVSWRYSDGYCGWAPLPPEAHFVHGSGFTYFGRHVAVGFEFGLSDYHYSFVSTRNFCDYSPSRHIVPRTTVRNVYRNTTVVNNYVVGNNNTVINRGIGRDTIARSSATRVREVSVRETPVQNLASVRGERVVRQGDRTVVERPQLPKTPPQVRSAQFVNRNDGQNGREAVRRTTTDSTAGSGQATSVARPQNNIGAADTRTGNRARENQPITQPRRVESVVNTETAQTGRGSGERRQNARANETRTQGSAPSATPELRSQQNQQQQQQRANRSLFGDSGARAVTPQNNPPAGRTVEPRNNTSTARTQSQPNYSSPATRTYPQGTAPAQPRGDAPGHMSPRGYEQAPRASVPTYSAPVYSGQQNRGQGNENHGQGNGSGGGGAYSAPRSESRSENRQGGGGGGGGGGRSESRSENRNDSGRGEGRNR